MPGLPRQSRASTVSVGENHAIKWRPHTLVYTAWDPPFFAPPSAMRLTPRTGGDDRSYLDHTATAVEPFWIDHLFLPLGTTV